MLTIEEVTKLNKLRNHMVRLGYTTEVLDILCVAYKKRRLFGIIPIPSTKLFFGTIVVNDVFFLVLPAGYNIGKYSDVLWWAHENHCPVVEF